ncbi:MAG: 6-carboxytetrahydropterin synthase [Cytophagaceae bacterium]|nr:6-carboxytetrahydropterin synthase [Cytophagaceae bacterium]MDW8455650.1 6-carboxytetrahydropterin synthase [Cytophagaceae bacterium]
MIFLSRKEHFNAAHKLYNPSWTEEKNKEVFGPCANPNGHGHNYELIVTLCGTPDPDTGFIFDLKKLSTLIREKVIEKVDHKNLNMDVDFMQGKMASTEVLAYEIFNILKKEIELQCSNAELYKITLYETPRNFVEVIREK